MNPLKSKAKNNSIVARLGAAIAKHKSDAVAILKKYNITPEKDSLGAIIKASFVSIKNGNKELAADLAALIKVKDATGTAKVSILDRIKGAVDKVKANIRAKRAPAAVSNAEGDAAVSDLGSDTQELIDAVGSNDVDKLTGMAVNFSSSDKQLMTAALIIIAMIAAFYFMVENLKPIKA